MYDLRRARKILLNTSVKLRTPWLLHPTTLDQIVREVRIAALEVLQVEQSLEEIRPFISRGNQDLCTPLLPPPLLSTSPCMKDATVAVSPPSPCRQSSSNSIFTPATPEPQAQLSPRETLTTATVQVAPLSPSPSPAPCVLEYLSVDLRAGVFGLPMALPIKAHKSVFLPPTPVCVLLRIRRENLPLRLTEKNFSSWGVVPKVISKKLLRSDGTPRLANSAVGAITAQIHETLRVEVNQMAIWYNFRLARGSGGGFWIKYLCGENVAAHFDLCNQQLPTFPQIGCTVRIDEQATSSPRTIPTSSREISPPPSGKTTAQASLSKVQGTPELQEASPYFVRPCPLSVKRRRLQHFPQSAAQALELRADFEKRLEEARRPELPPPHPLSPKRKRSKPPPLDLQLATVPCPSATTTLSSPRTHTSSSPKIRDPMVFTQVKPEDMMQDLPDSAFRWPTCPLQHVRRPRDQSTQTTGRTVRFASCLATKRTASSPPLHIPPKIHRSPFPEITAVEVRSVITISDSSSDDDVVACSPPLPEDQITREERRERAGARIRKRYPPEYWLLLLSIFYCVSSVLGQHFLKYDLVHMHGVRWGHIRASVDFKEVVQAVHALQILVNQTILDVERARDHFDQGWHRKKGAQALHWFEMRPAAPEPKLPENEALFSRLYENFQAEAEMHTFRCHQLLEEILHSFFSHDQTLQILASPLEFEELNLREIISSIGRPHNGRPSGKIIQRKTAERNSSLSLLRTSTLSPLSHIPQWYHRTDTPTNRRKRQVASLLLGGADAILGIWNRFEIMDNQRRISGLAAKQGELISVLGKASLKINENLHNIQKIKGTLISQLRWDKDLDFLLLLKTSFASVMRAATDLRFDLQNLANELAKLLAKIPPIGLFHDHELHKVVSSMVQAAESAGYHLHQPIRQAKTSFSVHHHQLHFHFHLPFVLREQAVIYKYLPLPLPLTNSSFHAMLSEHHHVGKLLLVSADQTKVSIIEEDFLRLQCTRGDTSWRCPKSFLFSNHPERHCLSRLLLFPQAEPRPICSFKLSPATTTVLEMHHSLFVWGNNFEVKFVCANETTQLLVNGFKKLPLSPGCRFLSEEYSLLTPEEDLDLAVRVTTDQFLAAVQEVERDLRLEEVVVRDVGEDFLSALFNDTISLPTSAPLDVSEIESLHARQTHKETASFHFLILYILLGLVLTVIVCLSVIYVYLYARHKKLCSPNLDLVEEAASPNPGPVMHSFYAPTYYIDDVPLPRIKEEPLDSF